MVILQLLFVLDAQHRAEPAHLLYAAVECLDFAHLLLQIWISVPEHLVRQLLIVLWELALRLVAVLRQLVDKLPLCGAT